MISKRVQEHFFNSYQFDRLYDEYNEPYAIMKRTGEPGTDIDNFGKVPICSLVVNLADGHVTAWRKLAHYNDYPPVTKLWQEMPQWKADLLGLACYPFLPDSEIEREE